MSIVKSKRATVTLAPNIEINAYLLPNGDIKLAGRNVTDAVEEPNNSLIRIMGVKSLKALPGADSSLIQIKADTGETVTPVSIDDAIAYWTKMAIKGNTKAATLIGALAAESIERRVDRAFGIQRTEEERDLRLATRATVRKDFRWLTDALKSHGFTEDKDYARFIYLFQSHTGIKTGGRDDADVETLVRLQGVQVQLTTLMECGVSPWDAIKRLR